MGERDRIDTQRAERIALCRSVDSRSPGGRRPSRSVDLRLGVRTVRRHSVERRR